MFTSEQLWNMMPDVAKTPITNEPIHPLNEEALEVISQHAAKAAKGNFAGISIYLSREYEANQYLEEYYQFFYEADKVIQVLENPELKLDILTDEDDIDLGVWVYIKWAPGKAIKHIGPIRVEPEAHVIEYLASIRPNTRMH